MSGADAPLEVPAAKRTPLAATSQPAVVERLCGGMDDLGAAARTPANKGRRPKAADSKPEWVSLIPKEPTPPPPPKPVDPFAHLKGEAKYVTSAKHCEFDASIMFRLGLNCRLICGSDWATRNCSHRRVPNRVMFDNGLLFIHFFITSMFRERTNTRKTETCDPKEENCIQYKING